MKIRKFLPGPAILLFTLFLFSTPAFAQEKKSDTAHIKTSAVCGQCKERIEGAFAFEKGVKTSTLDLETKMLTVVYNPARTDIDILRTSLSMVGYDADSVPADPKAYARLPACCKKDAPPH